MTATPGNRNDLCYRPDPRPYVERVRERLRSMSDVELISWGKEAARLARTNPGSVTARDEARAEWRRRHLRGSWGHSSIGQLLHAKG